MSGFPFLGVFCKWKKSLVEYIRNETFTYVFIILCAVTIELSAVSSKGCEAGPWELIDSLLIPSVR